MASLRNAHKLLQPEIRAKNLAALRVQARMLYWRVAGPASPDPVFVVGCSRAGTTVTYETLAAAPGLASFGFELPQFWHRLRGPAEHGWDSEAAYAEDARPADREHAQAYWYARLGPGRLLDKTCINTLRIPYLNALFPGAKFVYIHRDGRDNVSSLIDGWEDGGRFTLSQFLGPLPEPVAIDEGRFTDWRFFLPPGWRDYNRARLEAVCAHQWVSANEMALAARDAVGAERWIQLRYETIFEDPVGMFGEVFARLGIELTPELRRRCETIDRRPTSMVRGAPEPEKWKRRNPERIERVLERIEPTMTRLGYRIQ